MELKEVLNWITLNWKSIILVPVIIAFVSVGGTSLIELIKGFPKSETPIKK